MRKSLTGLILCFFLLVVVLIFFSGKNPSHFFRLSSHHITPELQWLGIIDMDNTQKISKESLLAGDEVVLVLDHADKVYREILQKISKEKDLSKDEMFSLVNLHLLDENNDGVIDAKDPTFIHLHVIRFDNKGDRYEIKKLPELGIKAIDVQKLSLMGRYRILMSDKSQRLLYDRNEFEK